MQAAPRAKGSGQIVRALVRSANNFTLRYVMCNVGLRGNTESAQIKNTSDPSSKYENKDLFTFPHSY